MSIAPIGVPGAPEVPGVTDVETDVEHAAPGVDLAGSFGKALEGNVRPIRPAAPPADLEGAVAALAHREPAARDTAPDVVLGGTAGPPMIGALRTRLAVTGGSAAADSKRALGTARLHAGFDPAAAARAAGFASDGAPSATAAAPPAALAPGLGSPVSALLAAAITRAAGSFRRAGAISPPPAPPSIPNAITAAAPATAVTSAAATASARSGLAAAALTPLEQAVHDLVEQLSGHRSRHAPGPLADQ